MIESKVVVEDAEILIRHEQCADPSWCSQNDLYIKSNSSDNNTLTTVVFNDYLSVYLYWENHSSANSVEVLYVPETGVLFMGCDRLSIRVDTRSQKLIDVDFVALFWGLERHKEFILETGELQCFLYSKSGKKLASAEVDPPYEMELYDQGIMFKSIVAGETWLKYAVRGYSVDT